MTSQPSRTQIKEQQLSKEKSGILSSCFGAKREKPKNQSQVSNQSQKNTRNARSNKTIMITQQRPLKKKAYDVEDKDAQEDFSFYRKVRFPKMSGQKQETKAETYAVQNSSGSKSRLLADKHELLFDLDDEKGVSNTFTVPYFDYEGLRMDNKCFYTGSNVIDGKPNAVHEKNKEQYISNLYASKAKFK